MGRFRRGVSVCSRCVVGFAILVLAFLLPAPLHAQDAAAQDAAAPADAAAGTPPLTAAQCAQTRATALTPPASSVANPAGTEPPASDGSAPSVASQSEPNPPRHVQPGLTGLDAEQNTAVAASDSAAPNSDSACSNPTPTATLQNRRYLIAPGDLLSSSSASPEPEDVPLFSNKTSREANLYAIAHPTNGNYPVSLRTGRDGGEEWEPAILQTLGFTLGQNGYRLATEQKTRRALVKETWHSYWLAISGLHTWSDGGKTWTVYIAHPAQGAVFNDIWTEHDPHGVLVPFGFNKVYWGSRLKAFWWDSVWELQWKFGPFSEASIGNVGLIPGKLGANTIVSSAVIGTGLASGEDMLDRYGIAKWETHTNNRVLIALLRSGLNPDRSFANLLRARYPWYRDRRPTLRDTEPPLP